MPCASLQRAAAWCLAVQAADIALTHSRHVEELEDKIYKLQEQLDETNKVCVFICVMLSLSIPHLSAHTHTHTCQNPSHTQQDLVAADTAAQQLEVKLNRSEQDKKFYQQELDQMSKVRHMPLRPRCFVLSLGRCSCIARA